nr:hypothetical protein CFP56_11899 [Quercus suber]
MGSPIGGPTRGHYQRHSTADPAYHPLYSQRLASPEPNAGPSGHPKFDARLQPLPDSSSTLCRLIAGVAAERSPFADPRCVARNTEAKPASGTGVIRNEGNRGSAVHLCATVRTGLRRFKPGGRCGCSRKRDDTAVRGLQLNERIACDIDPAKAASLSSGGGLDRSHVFPATRLDDHVRPGEYFIAEPFNDQRRLISCDSCLQHQPDGIKRKSLQALQCIQNETTADRAFMLARSRRYQRCTPLVWVMDRGDASAKNRRKSMQECGLNIAFRHVHRRCSCGQPRRRVRGNFMILISRAVFKYAFRTSLPLDVRIP